MANDEIKGTEQAVEATNQPEGNPMQRFLAWLGGKRKILVSSNGGAKEEMTVAEADTQAEVEKQAAEEKAADIPGATVEEVHSGETTKVQTTIPDEPEAEEKS